MTGPVIGIIGGSGLYQIDGLADVEWRRVESPFGEPSDEFCFGTARRPAGRVPAAPRPRPRAAAVGDQFPRQYRCAEALRASPTSSRCRRSAACARICRPATSCWSTSSSTAPSREPRASSAPAASRMCRWRIRSAADSATRWPRPGREAGIAMKRGGTYMVMEGPQFSTLAESNLYRSLGLRRDRHDQHARGQARARGGDLLRHRRHGHRLRLLASRPRRRHGRHDRRGAARQCREGEGARQARGAATIARITAPARKAASTRSTTR